MKKNNPPLVEKIGWKSSQGIYPEGLALDGEGIPSCKIFSRGELMEMEESDRKVGMCRWRG